MTAQRANHAANEARTRREMAPGFSWPDPDGASLLSAKIGAQQATMAKMATRMAKMSTENEALKVENEAVRTENGELKVENATVNAENAQLRAKLAANGEGDGTGKGRRRIEPGRRHAGRREGTVRPCQGRLHGRACRQIDQCCQRDRRHKAGVRLFGSRQVGHNCRGDGPDCQGDVCPESAVPQSQRIRA